MESSWESILESKQPQPPAILQPAPTSPPQPRPVVLQPAPTAPRAPRTLPTSVEAKAEQEDQKEYDEEEWFMDQAFLDERVALNH